VKKGRIGGNKGSDMREVTTVKGRGENRMKGNLEEKGKGSAPRKKDELIEGEKKKAGATEQRRGEEGVGLGR